MNEREFGLRIKARREELGLSQQDLAIALGLDQGKISLIERGARKVDSIKELPKLVKALKCSLASLIQENEIQQYDSAIGKLLNEYFPDIEFSDFEVKRINQFLEPVINHYVKQDPEISKKVVNEE